MSQPPPTLHARQVRGPSSRELESGRPWRVIALILLIVGLGVALTLRLMFYQIVDQGWLSAKAASDTGGSNGVQLRGLIEDASGNPLAISDELFAVVATPQQIPNKTWEAHKLSGPLRESPKAVLMKMKGRTVYANIASGITQTTMKAIEALDLPGITYEALPNRVYPEKTLASQVLGFVGANGGQYGLEEEYNPLLSGSESRHAFLRWARGQRNDVSFDNSTNLDLDHAGATLKLSLDTYMEDVVDRLLKSYMKRSHAQGGTIIITNPQTGRIIAMTNYPWFNPNKHLKYKWSTWSNPAISSTYEPGSTFKIVTMSAGIDAHVITPRTTIYDPGYITYPCDQNPIHNWDYPQGNGFEDMTQVLQHSANVGASWVANRLGARRFYPYVRRFGVGQITQIDLQGEQSGYVPLPGAAGSKWTCGNLYVNSFGQALTVTPMQLLSAANAIANGGWLIRPEVVKKIDYRGVSVRIQPHRERRVISARTSRTVTHMLTQSALGPPGQYGEASCALVPGYWIAAKTGTANVVSHGRYLTGPGSTITSTVAYAPTDHPRFSVLVVLRNPRKPWPFAEWGSQTAAPLVHKIFAALFLRYHVPPKAHNAPRVLGSQKAFPGGCNF